MHTISRTALIFAIASSACLTVLAGPPTFNGDRGDVISFAGSEIETIDGKGNWTIVGTGQPLTILKKVDGDGNRVLRNFGDVRILEKKDGKGSLTVEDAKSVYIKEVNGDGHVYLNSGTKQVDLKDGTGDICFKGSPPRIGRKDGKGAVKPC